MVCPLVDCQHAQVTGTIPPDGGDCLEFRCSRCGHFKPSQTLLASSDFAQHSYLMEGLRRYVKAENSEGRIP
jgi:hypothetical protein